MTDKFNIDEYERDVTYGELFEADKEIEKDFEDSEIFPKTEEPFPPTEGLNPPGPRYL